MGCLNKSTSRFYLPTFFTKGTLSSLAHIYYKESGLISPLGSASAIAMECSAPGNILHHACCGGVLDCVQ